MPKGGDMSEESTRGDKFEVSAASSSGAHAEFRPVEITTTHELDLTGLGDRDAQSVRERVLGANQSDVIVNSVLGMTARASRIIFIRLPWGRWGQFPQVIRPVLMTSGGTGDNQNIVKETISRTYVAEPEATS
jgi:hypothetical protein